MALVTCIAGYAKDGSVWIGADSAAASSYVRFPVVEPKIVDLGDLLLGYTTSFRFGQIVKHHVSLPRDCGEDPTEYLVREFVPELRHALSEHGWTKKDGEREETGTALIAYRGRLFTYQSDSSITESQHGIDACGSGQEFALGAMSFAESIGRSPKNIVTAGLEAAARFAPGVMDPFVVRRAP